MANVLDLENMKVVGGVTAIGGLIALWIWIWTLQNRIANIEQTTQDIKTNIQSVSTDMVEIKKSIAVLTSQALARQ